MIPLYGFLEGDTLGLLIFAYEEDTVDMLAQRLRSAASVRVSPDIKLNKVVFREEELEPSKTLKEIGISALERFDVLENSNEL